uniref:RBR-type E3 ubiquitin transferase n=1 Tax=Geotrypetes seraphini TaxID=260995 RepID=A0A6P8Q8D0_GEOSA|nr:E3 ubiquitin-protein ligase RNF19A-like isoform X1 [Geotrypetes seraphini]XP_033792545.1 E3 ubiquitin-protein ligase RNF19A-like isoform X1 [Geotrypetes seraphini]XP_033792546.1 E3 ubiquitin-protein ligase RNF19A-like isoform X1 [Geotrypetes seraphini]XP_033792547.1 E3 ubiquitin-protein ligase RNF19A-like isoform X1 [Geotrypetes seraphini]
MKRPKQPPQLSILDFFGQEPRTKGEPIMAEEEGTVAESQEEFQLTLTSSEGTATSSPVLSDSLLECPLCLLPQPLKCFPPLSCCSHLSCLDCLQRYLQIEIMESRVQIACPQCPELVQPSDIHSLLLENALLEKYEEYLLRRLLVSDPDSRWCPAPDCSYAVIAYGCAECPRLTCGRKSCGTEFCYHCRQLWHPNKTCEQAWRQWSQTTPGVTEPSTLLILSEEHGHALDVNDIKVCPRCGAFIMKVKDGSCNRMNCTVCGCLFCWLCLKEITDVHFLSPSGCTFWGKKPWSRSRKILWQVGMLLGAPMVISLAAGIAIPVIIIGIPIYMGRKMFNQSKKNKLPLYKRCLVVVSGVLLSAFISPVIAAATVGVGVPLVLTYIYGVVLLSICRNRWRCRGSSGGSVEQGVVELNNLIKLNELWSALPNTVMGENTTQEAASLPSTSYSHQDREGAKQQDNQSASTVALAGSMLSEVQESSYREGINFEVEVEVETHPQTIRQQSLGSIMSVQSLSVESLGCSREQLCSSDTTSRGTAAETHSGL